MIKDRRDELVQKVRSMIQERISNEEGLLHGMKTVDALERLGVSYHFEKEMSLFMDFLNRKPAPSNDLCAVALQFRLLRQHHYDNSCEVFKNFMSEDGNLNTDTQQSNVDALLSLYEAAHFGKCNEDFLTSAINFTKDRLSSLAKCGQLLKPVLMKVQHALAAPTHRRIKRLEAKLYISVYEDDEGSDQDLVELAKLDFHILQQMHRDEVKSISL
ncbi:hypothetical protein EJB05_36702, partial [Eragrostis curvula]